MQVVTRYAPSPTGPLHIGGARTALYSWAFARHGGGRFHLRFEDTDRARSTRGLERGILEALEWLGIDWDPVPGLADGIPRQSERLERYATAVDSLLASGAAYRCTCTPEEVAAMRERARAEGRRPAYDGTCRERGIGPDTDLPFCVRLAVPPGGATRWTDQIAGPSGQDTDDLDDFVILRTDGTPIYHLAVVVDDHDMGITHVIRGREHMTSTPRQLLLYQALSLEPPEFAHVPLLVEPDGKKLSKRKAATSVQSYRERGFPPEALLNYIARLGWGRGDLEILSRDELVEQFTLEGVGRSPAQVHEDKLLWLSQHYLKELPAERLHAALAPFLEAEAGRPVEIDAGLERLIDLLRARSRTLEDMASQSRFYWMERLELDPKAARKFLTPASRAPLADLRSALASLPQWTEAGIREALEGVVRERDLKLGALAQPARVAVVGGTVSPGIFETLALLGRERALARLDAALERIGV